MFSLFSWKRYATKAVNEGTNCNDLQRETKDNNAAAKIATAINALSDAQIAQTKSEDRNEQKDRAISVATLFLVLLTVVFTYLTWVTLSGQLKEMKSAGEQTKQIIEANGKLAEAASKQADAAAENAKTAHDSYVASQRAWVGPTNAKIDGDIAVGKPLSIVINYLNTGREPAINFVYTGDAFTSTPNEDSSGTTFAKINADFAGCRKAQLTGGGSVIFPSAGGLTPSGQSLTITKPDSFVEQNVIDGINTVVADGCFLYKSIGIVRHSYFCYFYNAKQTKAAALNICQNGNGAD